MTEERKKEIFIQSHQVNSKVGAAIVIVHLFEKDCPEDECIEFIIQLKRHMRNLDDRIRIEAMEA